MRICVITCHSSPFADVGSGNSGGMTVYLSNLYKNLAEYNNIDIFTCGNERDNLSNCFKVISMNRKNPQEFAYEVIRYHNLNSYDILHTHYWISGIVGKEIKKKIDIPWVHTFHTVESLKGTEMCVSRIEIEEEIMRRNDFIISPSIKEKIMIKKVNSKARIFVIPHGVDFDRYKGWNNYKNFEDSEILYVGRIEPLKGLDILIKSLKMLKRNVKLTVVGGPSKGSDYFNNVKSSAEGLNVTFAGKIKHDKLGYYYANTKAVVIPSRYESFGLVGLEAMVFGKPIVTFSSAGISEFAGNKSGIYLNVDSRNMAKAIDYLNKNPSDRLKMGRNGRRRALKYKWHKVAKRYQEVYEKIIKN